MGDKWEKMSNEELKEEAKQRNKRTGCFKKTALAAQNELWSRYHWGDPGSCLLGADMEDTQYNG